MLKEWLYKERMIWHKRFLPSLVAGIAVALITLFFEMTTSNIILLASLGASAAILTHENIHRLIILRTVIFAYLIALLVSLLIEYLGRLFELPFSLMVLLTVTFVTLSIYLFNVFHPPVVAASLSFIMFDGGYWEMMMIFFSVLILLVLIKLLVYAFYYEKLIMKKFMDEFKRYKDVFK